jgi:MGT family glycosyltransferase
MSALGRELAARGHRVTYFQLRDLDAKVRAEGLNFHPYGERDHPVGSLQESLAALGRLSGAAAQRFTIRAVARTTRALCRDLPGAIRAAGVDALVIDQMEPGGAAVADYLGLPFVTVCNALAVNRDWSVPPPFSPWPYQDTWRARWRNRAGYAMGDRATRPILRVVNEYRRAWRLAPLRSGDESFSRAAQICQMPQAFDFPRTASPDTFHYVGPLRRRVPGAIPFPWDRLDGRPLVYASLGTLQNSRAPVFQCIASACAGLGVQVVISHGGGLSDAEARSLNHEHVVTVAYAPQLDLLARARLTITHAGLNTVLDALANGVPLVTIPIAYEQPAIARRVEWTGTGVTVPLQRLSVERLRGGLSQVLGDERFFASARRMRAEIAAAGGVQLAADLTEGAVTRAACSPAGDSSALLTAAMNRAAARPSQIA